ncbi:MAG: non-hydrolyzing UDP-N-acetylglucosamine 2-epimerase [Geminicoccaceae bacterium]
MRIMVVLGTRPEAIKLAPVVKAFAARPEIDLALCTTGQHREMVQQVFNVFGLRATIDLDVMMPGQSLSDVTTRVLDRMSELLVRETADWILVQGDTTTAFATSLAAYYQKIPIAHVEAGLRSGDIYAPWPEEVNRRMISVVGAQHFAPTAEARGNLLAEGCDPEAVHVTGNTVIDALFHFQNYLDRNTALKANYDRQFDFLKPERRLILVTGHRRENHDGGIERICEALLTLAAREDVQVVYPVHPNPNVREPVEALLSDQPNITLLPPQDYLGFVYLMARASIILTDSGGIQEEAPALGKPVLVTRETTERPEGVAAGTAKLVGTDPEKMIAETSALLDDPAAYEAMSRAHNPYGDGRASERIVQAILGERASAAA